MASRVRDYYQVLGVPRDASQKDIKSAFRKLARQHHPDVNPGDSEAAERFKEINEANEVLSDPEKRRKYDELGPDWRHYDEWEKAGRPGGGPFGQGAGTPPGGSPFGQSGRVEYRTTTPEDLEDLFGSESPFSDFFHDLYGSRQSSGRGFEAGPQPGQDIEGEASITLEEAYRGTQRTVELQGAEGPRRVEVRIPAGIRDGARLRVSGQGGPGRGGGAAGDLYVRIRVLPHPAFRREGDDLYVRVPVPLDVALLGGEVPVTTLRGTTVSLRVPESTQNGSRLRLRGLGMPHRGSDDRGDMYAEVDVRLPVPLPPEARELAERLRQVGATSDR